MSEPIYLRRSEATKLIERVRELVCPAATTEQARIVELFTEAGIPPLRPCGDEAHSNAHIDNCMTCAPRWGYVGPEVKIR